MLAPFAKQFTDLGQGHVFTNYYDLSLPKLQQLYHDVQSFQLPQLLSAVDSIILHPSVNSNDDSFAPYRDGGIDLSHCNDIDLYTPFFTCAGTSPFLSANEREQAQESLAAVPHAMIIPPTRNELGFYYDIGMQSIIAGQAGILLLSGGQGSRLGFDHCKGMFHVETPSNLTLFLRILFSRQLMLFSARQYARNMSDNQSNMLDIHIPLIILTSDLTRRDVADYFASLEKIATYNQQKQQQQHSQLENAITHDMLQDIFFIEQGAYPAISVQGKIITSDDQMCMAPNGNGGLIDALLARLSSLTTGKDALFPKLSHLMSLNIDNIVNKPMDPISLGYAIHSQADVCVKTLPKSHPEEKVGCLATRNGQFHIIEYSEIASRAHERDEQTGDLLYNDGNTNMFILRVEFLYNLPRQHHSVHLPLHRADKQQRILPNTIMAPNIANKNAVASDNTTAVVPVIKFEKFFFDIFSFAKTMRCIRVNRFSHFLPVKSRNAPPGETIIPDTPAYCIDFSSRATVLSLLALGVAVFDSQNRRIVEKYVPVPTNLFDSTRSSAFASRHTNLDMRFCRTCLGYDLYLPQNIVIEQQTELDPNNIDLGHADLGQGIEFDPSQFWALAPPSSSFPQLQLPSSIHLDPLVGLIIANTGSVISVDGNKP